MADCVAEQLESIYLRRSIAIVLRIIPYLAILRESTVYKGLHRVGI